MDRNFSKFAKADKLSQSKDDKKIVNGGRAKLIAKKVEPTQLTTDKKATQTVSTLSLEILENNSDDSFEENIEERAGKGYQSKKVIPMYETPISQSKKQDTNLNISPVGAAATSTSLYAKQSPDGRPENIFNQSSKVNFPNLHEMYTGPRFNENKELIKYSVLGKPDVFLRMQNIREGLKQKTMAPQNPKSIINPASKFATSSTTDIPDFKANGIPFIRNVSERPADAQPLPPGNNMKLKVTGSMEDSFRIDKFKGPPSTGKVSKQGSFYYKAAPTRKFGDNNTHMSKAELLDEAAEIQERIKENETTEKNKLNKLSCTEKILLSKEEKVINKFMEFEKQWEKRLKKIAQTLGREPNPTGKYDLLVEKTEKWHQRQEKLEALERLKPLGQKYEGRVWYLTLRKYQDKTQKEKPADSSNQSEKRTSIITIDEFPKGFYTSFIDSQRKPVEIVRKQNFIQTYTDGLNQMDSYRNSTTGTLPDYIDFSSTAKEDYLKRTFTSQGKKLKTINPLAFDEPDLNMRLEGKSIFASELKSLQEDGHTLHASYQKFDINTLKKRRKVVSMEQSSQFIQLEKDKGGENKIESEIGDEVYKEHFDNKGLAKEGGLAFGKIYQNKKS